MNECKLTSQRRSKLKKYTQERQRKLGERSEGRIKHIKEETNRMELDHEVRDSIASG